MQWLSDLSQDVRNALKAKVTSQAAGDQDDCSKRELLKLTLEEVKQGWASGLLAEQELDDRLGRGWVPSHRFGLVSAGKFQLIDDFSGSLVNATVICKEQVTVDGVDNIVAVVKLWSRLLAGNNVAVALTKGEVLRGTEHADFCATVELFGKRYDLEAAYKQCPLADEENMVSVEGFEDPSHPGNTLVLLIHVFPFGASASVVQFNRVAASLKKIMVDCLFLPAINSYDDFPLVVPKVLSVVVDMAVKALGKLTGWRWKGGKRTSNTKARSWHWACCSISKVQ